MSVHPFLVGSCYMHTGLHPYSWYRLGHLVPLGSWLWIHLHLLHPSDSYMIFFPDLDSDLWPWGSLSPLISEYAMIPCLLCLGSLVCEMHSQTWDLLLSVAPDVAMQLGLCSLTRCSPLVIKACIAHPHYFAVWAPWLYLLRYVCSPKGPWCKLKKWRNVKQAKKAFCKCKSSQKRAKSEIHCKIHAMCL